MGRKKDEKENTRKQESDNIVVQEAYLVADMPHAHGPNSEIEPISVTHLSRLLFRLRESILGKISSKDEGVSDAK